MSAKLDQELLDAFVPEFEAAALRLASVPDAAAALRALDQLRAMATALGAPSLVAMTKAAAGATDPFDAAALRAAAEAAARHARAIGAAGADLPPVSAAPAPSPAAASPAPPRAAPDRDLLEAFFPEFDVACRTVIHAETAATAARAVVTLRNLAEAADLGSLRTLLAGTAGPLEAGELVTLAVIARAARAQAERIREAGRDLELPGVASSRRRVLVVDDSPMMRRLVREIVSADPDLEVVGEAPDGVAALAAMQALNPDLVLLDIEMPEMDGIGVLRRWALRGGGAIVVVSSAAPAGSVAATEVRRLAPQA